HGVLHLMGHGDATEEDKLRMRKKEEACLSLR
ncbi:rRNA maturation factor, partial [Fulvivirga sp. RKSG066]